MGLRELKKEQTRRTIEDAAFRLFAERGFAATTVADIAEAAVIAPRTFFAYFPSKEDVVFANFDEMAATLATRLDERGPKETTFDALRAWIGDLIEDQKKADAEDHEVVRRQLLCDNESLAAHDRHLMGRVEGLIAESVAKDLGEAPDDLRPKMVAAAALAALRALSPEEGKPKQAPTDEDLEVLDEAFAFLRGGIAALQRQRTAAAR